MPQITKEQRQALDLARQFPTRAVRIGQPCPEDGHPVTAVTGAGSHSNCQIVAVPSHLWCEGCGELQRCTTHDLWDCIRCEVRTGHTYMCPNAPTG